MGVLAAAGVEGVVAEDVGVSAFGSGDGCMEVAGMDEHTDLVGGDEILLLDLLFGLVLIGLILRVNFQLLNVLADLLSQ